MLCLEQPSKTHSLSQLHYQRAERICAGGRSTETSSRNVHCSACCDEGDRTRERIAGWKTSKHVLNHSQVREGTRKGEQHRATGISPWFTYVFSVICCSDPSPASGGVQWDWKGSRGMWWTQLLHEEQLREQGLENLENRQLKGNMMEVCENARDLVEDEWIGMVWFFSVPMRKKASDEATRS